MTFIGIDPGAAGGIAVLSDCTPSNAYKYTSAKLIEVVKGCIQADSQHTEAWVEKVHSMPGQGVASMFTFGTGYGQILGILEALGIPINLVPPSKWKSEVGVTHDKATSINKAQYLFPDISLLATPRCRVPSDGMAEALLIAEYGKRFRSKEKYGLESKKDKFFDSSKYF